jgi:hypothetical protein
MAYAFPEAPTWIPCGFLGSACNLTAEQLKKVSGRLVRIFVHRDGSEAGSKAASRWADALTGAGCTVELVHVGRLAGCQPDGKPIEDLNDALRAQTDLNQFAKEATA